MVELVKPRRRLLDLFCGAGGAAMGYHRAGFEVVGVDIKPQPNYPFEFWQQDALDVLREVPINRHDGHGVQSLVLEQFDAIHASPPCQAYSNITSDPGSHPNLVGATRDLLQASGLPWVIENVVGAPLIHPVRLCGSSFGLDVRRHRLFETNWTLMVPSCAHGQQTNEFDIYEHGRWFKSPVARVYGIGGGKGGERWGEAMGIDWMTRAELAQAIPPAYTELIGAQLLAHMRVAA